MIPFLLALAQVATLILNSPHLAVPAIRAISHDAQGGLQPYVSLAWDAPPPPSTVPTGYRIYWGTKSGVYPNVIDVGLTLSFNVVLPGDGGYYIAVTAYNPDGESAKTPEVFTTVGQPIECGLPLGSQALSIFITKLQQTNGRVGSKTTLYFQLSSASAVTRVVVRLNDVVVGNPVTGVDAGGIWFTSPLTPGDYAVAVDATNQFGCNTIQRLGADGKPLTVTVKP